jgi:hypothetical protein
MNDLICSSSVMPLHDRTSNSLMCDIKSSNYLRPIIDRNHLVKKCKTRSHVKHGLLWLDCDSQIRTKLANLWEIFDRILKNGLFDVQSFWFKKESFWFQKSAPWCKIVAYVNISTKTMCVTRVCLALSFENSVSSVFFLTIFNQVQIHNV